MVNLIWFVTIFILMLYLNHWIMSHVHGIGLLVFKKEWASIWLHFLIFLPGIIIHELSHAVMAFLLGVKIGGFHLGPKKLSDENIALGSITVFTDSSLLRNLVGVAPLIFGSFAVWMISVWLNVNIFVESIADGDMVIFIEILLENITTPTFWLWLYLLFVIGNAMLPSTSDTEYLGPVLLFSGVITTGIIAFDLVTFIPAYIHISFSYFIYGTSIILTIIVIVNLIFMIVILVMEFLLNRMTGLKIQYN